MKRLVSVALVAATLAIGCPPAAFAAPPSIQTDPSVVRTQKASQGAERVTAILMSLFSDPGFAAARTPEALSAYLSARRAKIADGRREVREIAAGLTALPSVSDASSPAHLQISDAVVDDIAAFALKVDRLLRDVEGMADALVAGDQAKAAQFAESLMVGSISVVDAQGLMLRSRLLMLPAGGAAYARVTGLACFYEGVATIQRGAFGIMAPVEARAAIAKSTGCMRDSAREGRIALAREIASPPPGAPPGFMREIAQIYREAFDLNDEGALLLDGMGVEFGSDDRASLFSGFGRRVVAWEGRIQALTARELAALSPDS